MRRIHLLLIIGCLSLLSFNACDNEDGSQAPAPETPTVDLASTRAALILQASEQIIIPAYESLLDKSEEFTLAITSFADSPDEANLVAAQTSLKAVWLSWQDVSFAMFGPAESVALRKALATYPTDAGKIEDNIVSGTYILASLDNRAAIGFPALDYLLNGLGGNNEEILSMYQADQNADARKAYLQELANEIQSKVSASLNGWLPSEGNYVAEFNAPASLGTDVGSSLGLIVNAIDLHYQRFLRDGKIAIPAGVRSAGVPRPKTVEVFYGGYSVELLVASLNAYKRLFMGIGADEKDGVGIYDYLVQLDQKTLAEDMEREFDEAIAASSELNDPLQDEIEVNLEKVNNVFIELQQLVVLIKSDMASVMGISITNQDNDGD